MAARTAGLLVRLVRIVAGLRAHLTRGELGQIPVVVALPIMRFQRISNRVQLDSRHKQKQRSVHFVVEHFRFARLGRRDQVIGEHL